MTLAGFEHALFDDGEVISDHESAVQVEAENRGNDNDEPVRCILTTDHGGGAWRRVALSG